MKNLILFIVILFTFNSCVEKDKCLGVVCQNGQICFDGTCLGSQTNVLVNSNISENTTWTNNNVYELSGRIVVEAGVILTIEAGTIIKGQAGTGNNSSVLIVSRNAKLNAIGSQTLPIIFTSIADEITTEQVNNGNFVSPNLGNDASGLWGGLIILGNAPISASSNEIQIEGIPTTDPNGLYGGNISNDNSGIIKYVSIRHGGTNIGNGNEINGLTLGGVGSETIIDNIEIIANQDDGIEFFGGTVNVSNLIVVNSSDDAIDTDQSWSGTLDNFIVICGAATDHSLEIDGAEGVMIASNNIKNGSIKGSSSAELADFRSCAVGTFENIFFFGFTDPTTDGRCDFSTSDQCSIDNLNNNLIFNNLEIKTTFSLSTIFKNGTDVFATIVNNRTVGANKSNFSWTSSYSLLGDF
jgi:hypothetical protein